MSEQRTQYGQVTPLETPPIPEDTTEALRARVTLLEGLLREFARECRLHDESYHHMTAMAVLKRAAEALQEAE